MILSNLWGLLLLLAIPVLILIYIIKRENRERAVSGTYLWHLSERFLKKRLPIKRLSVFLTFLLQLVILSLFAVSAMEPAMTLGHFSGRIVVIDASASMLTEVDGVSRFEAAVAEAKDIAESGLCPSMTVIIASDTPSCPVMGGSISEALDALDNATCGYGGIDLYETMKLVREASSRIGLARVIFYTDTEYADVENVEIVDMRRGETNLAVTDLTYAAGKFQGTVVSYGEDREISAMLEVDGEIVDLQTVSCLDGVPTSVKFAPGLTAFAEATLRVDVEDALEIDNRYSVAGPSSDPISVLLLGEEVLFFETGLGALGNCEVTVKEAYDPADDGSYDLYIFSGCVPKDDAFPQKGMTLIFAPYNDSPMSMDEMMNQTLGGMYVAPIYCGETGLERVYDRDLELDPLLEGMDKALLDVYVRYYSSSRLYGNPYITFGWQSFCSPISASTAEEALGYRRVLDNGTRHYMFTFPLSETNLAMTPAFLMLLKNACNLAAPPAMEKTRYPVGETVELNLRGVPKSIAITAPDGTVTNLTGSNPVFVPASPGIHTLTYESMHMPDSSDSPTHFTYQYTEDGYYLIVPVEKDPEETGEVTLRTRTAAFFAHIPLSEYETYSGDTIYYHNTFDMDRDGKLLTTTLLPFAAVILSALLILEWGYYYRGKH